MFLKNIISLFIFSKKSVARIAVFSLLVPAFFPIAASIGLETQYTYANEDVGFELPSSNSWTLVKLTSPKSSFVIQLETRSLIEDGDAIAFEIYDSFGTRKTLDLEIEWWEAILGKYFTNPTYFPATDTLFISCKGCEKIESPKFILRALDPSSHEEKLTFRTENFTAQYNTSAAPNWLSVVPRSKWWADETLRYKTHPTWIKIFEQNAKIIPSEASLKAEAKNNQIESHLRKEYPQEFVTNEVIRSENGNDLVWPIEKTKYVQKITLHHTAEANSKDLSDEEVMRSMYYYHTIVRGWGDIGYQYIIWQRGVVYEGRAGGDYVVGAHASWNNRGSVGVSVMWNFENQAVVREQKAAILSTVSFLSEKYGIDTGKTTIGHRACKVWEACATRDSEVLSFMWHRDIGYTSCPGENLYSLLTNEYQIELAAQTKGFIPKANPINKPSTVNSWGNTLHPAPILDIGTIQSPANKPVQLGSAPIRTPNVSQNLKNQTTVENIQKIDWPLWSTVRIKLSFPDSLKTIDLEAIGTKRVFQVNSSERRLSTSKISATIKNGRIQYTINGKKYLAKRISFASDVVRIGNWNRIPSWDSSWIYNDNEFRSKIEIGIENGKLLIINELPIEAYLRWLAEFSNGENQAKAETIIIAARSYVNFYSQKENRKFPGKPYDGSDNPDIFQKYLGYGYEKRSPISVKYVQNTAWKIITYEGKAIKPWYFTQSSGQTLSAQQYCENRKSRGEIAATAKCENIPYLQSKEDIGSKWLSQKWHWVGISWAGASYLAQEKNMTNEEIIEYFLTGTKVKKIY